MLRGLALAGQLLAQRRVSVALEAARVEVAVEAKPHADACHDEEDDRAGDARQVDANAGEGEAEYDQRKRERDDGADGHARGKTEAVGDEQGESNAVERAVAVEEVKLDIVADDRNFGRRCPPLAGNGENAAGGSEEESEDGAQEGRLRGAGGSEWLSRDVGPDKRDLDRDRTSHREAEDERRPCKRARGKDHRGVDHIAQRGGDAEGSTGRNVDSVAVLPRQEVQVVPCGDAVDVITSTAGGHTVLRGRKSGKQSPTPRTGGNATVDCPGADTLRDLGARAHSAAHFPRTGRRGSGKAARRTHRARISGCSPRSIVRHIGGVIGAAGALLLISRLRDRDV